jgi:glutamine phosphoribosylpyrophosphate amidotransferase
MCGIAGYIGTLEKEDLWRLKVLHNFLDTRGGDGSGVSYSKNGRISFMKSAEMANKFTAEYTVEPTKHIINMSFHSRKSSIGASTKENAHPFVFGKKSEENESDYYSFSIVKNGTISNWKELLKKYNPYDEKFVSHINVDSQALGYLIYFNPKQVENILKEYIGGCAFIIHSKNQTIVFKGASKEYTTDKEISDERPLYEGLDDKGNLYWASEEWMLKGIGVETTAPVEQNTLLIYEDNKLISKIFVDRSTSLRREPVVYTNSKSQFNYGNYGDYRSYNNYEGSSYYNSHWEDWEKPSKKEDKIWSLQNTANISKVKQLLYKEKLVQENLLNYISIFG